MQGQALLPVTKRCLILPKAWCPMHSHFQQYLRDAEWLALALEDRFNGMLGEAALAVSDLTEQRPLAGAVSFMQVDRPYTLSPASIEKENSTATARLLHLIDSDFMPAELVARL